MTSEIRVGLIGYGLAGRVFHAPVIQSVPGFKLKKILQRRTGDARERYPWVEVVQDAAAIFDDSEIDLVVVATPNDSHFEMARNALLAHKHVVLEKPFAITSAEASQLIELARKQGQLLSPFQNRRWDGDFLTVRKILNEGLLGRLVEYESHFDRFRNRPQGTWKDTEGPGSGILFDLGSHLIDQAQVLFGLPQMVTADLRTQKDSSRITDNFELILHYDKLKVTLKASMLVREPGPRFILHGTFGSFVKYGLDPQEDALKEGRSPSTPGWGEEPMEMFGRLNTEIEGSPYEARIETVAGCYQDYYQNILDAIRDQAELAVKPEEGLNTIRIIELAMQSSQEQRTIPFSLT
jgi:scyllo-inositol 2-dehydrogenase (NADP+)